jgi:hypothetical protein
MVYRLILPHTYIAANSSNYLATYQRTLNLVSHPPIRPYLLRLASSPHVQTPARCGHDHDELSLACRPRL